MWQHNVIRRYARQRVDEHVNIVELCLAKERIRNMVAAYAGQVRGKRAGVKATRFLNPERTSPRARIENIAPEVAGLLTGETTDTPTETTPSYAAMMHLPDSVDDDGSVHRAHESVVDGVAGTTPKLSLRRPAKKGSSRKGVIKPDMNPVPVPDVTGAAAAEDADLDMDGWGGDYDMPM